MAALASVSSSLVSSMGEFSFQVQIRVPTGTDVTLPSVDLPEGIKKLTDIVTRVEPLAHQSQYTFSLRLGSDAEGVYTIPPQKLNIESGGQSLILTSNAVLVSALSKGQQHRAIMEEPALNLTVIKDDDLGLSFLVVGAIFLGIVALLMFLRRKDTETPKVDTLGQLREELKGLSQILTTATVLDSMFWGSFASLFRSILSHIGYVEAQHMTCNELHGLVLTQELFEGKCKEDCLRILADLDVLCFGGTHTSVQRGEAALLVLMELLERNYGER